MKPDEILKYCLEDLERGVYILTVYACMGVDVWKWKERSWNE